MLKGTLEGCILKVIDGSETYGYEILQQLRQYGFDDIAEGTIYPLLLRLEKNGLLTAQHRASAVGPPRKYFSITPTGQAELHSFLASWRALEQAVNQVFSDGGNSYAGESTRTEQTK